MLSVDHGNAGLARQPKARPSLTIAARLDMPVIIYVDATMPLTAPPGSRSSARVTTFASGRSNVSMTIFMAKPPARS